MNFLPAPYTMAEVSYLDANRAGVMHPAAVEAFTRWLNRGSPTGQYAGARDLQKMAVAFRRDLANACGIELKGAPAFSIFFFDSPEAAHCYLIDACVRSFLYKAGRLPHVLLSAGEAAPIHAACRRLAAENLCQYTVLALSQAGATFGAPDMEALRVVLQNNTCLLSVSAASADTGVVPDLGPLFEAAREARVPVHTDATLLFNWKDGFRPGGADAFTITADRFGGPPGLAMLVLRQALIEGYNMPLPVAAAENTPAIASARAALRVSLEGRADKNVAVARLREILVKTLAARLTCYYFDDFPPDAETGLTHRGSAEVRRALRGDAAFLVWYECAGSPMLPNTVTYAIWHADYSAEKARASLEAAGVLVSALQPAGIQAPVALQGRTIRISLCETTTIEDIKRCVKAILQTVPR